MHNLLRHASNELSFDLADNKGVYQSREKLIMLPTNDLELQFSEGFDWSVRQSYSMVKMFLITWTANNHIA